MAVLNETAAAEREKMLSAGIIYRMGLISLGITVERLPGAGLCNLRNLHRTPVAYALLSQTNCSAAPWV